MGSQIPANHTSLKDCQLFSHSFFEQLPKQTWHLLAQMIPKKLFGPTAPQFVQPGYSCVEANSAHGFTSAEHVILFVTYSNRTARSLQPELLAGVDKSITFLMTIPLVNPSMNCDGVWYLDLSLRPLCYMQQPHKKPHLFPPYPFPNIIFSLLTYVLAYVLIVLACILTS